MFHQACECLIPERQLFLKLTGLWQKIHKIRKEIAVIEQSILQIIDSFPYRNHHRFPTGKQEIFRRIPYSNHDSIFGKIHFSLITRFHIKTDPIQPLLSPHRIETFPFRLEGKSIPTVPAHLRGCDQTFFSVFHLIQIHFIHSLASHPAPYAGISLAVVQFCFIPVHILPDQAGQLRGSRLLFGPSSQLNIPDYLLIRTFLNNKTETKSQIHHHILGKISPFFQIFQHPFDILTQISHHVVQCILDLRFFLKTDLLYLMGDTTNSFRPFSILTIIDAKQFISINGINLLIHYFLPHCPVESLFVIHQVFKPGIGRSHFLIENIPVFCTAFRFVAQLPENFHTNVLHGRPIAGIFQSLNVMGVLFPGKLTLLIAFVEIGIRSRFLQSSCNPFAETLPLTSSGQPVLHRTVRPDNKKCRESTDCKLFFQPDPFAFFHVILHTNEMRIHKLTGFRQSEDVFQHILTRSAPAGIAIHKHQLVFCTGLFQCLSEGQITELHPLCSHPAKETAQQCGP